MYNKVTFLMTVAISLVAIGCSENVSIRGKVTFSDDQSPLTVGMVFFDTDSYQARGLLAPDGTYELGSTGLKDGLPPGEYRVYVSGASISDPNVPPEANAPPLPLIDPKYESGLTSGLSVKVDRSTRTFDFSVDRNQATVAKLKAASK